MAIKSFWHKRSINLKTERRPPRQEYRGGNERKLDLKGQERGHSKEEPKSPKSVRLGQTPFGAEQCGSGRLRCLWETRPERDSNVVGTPDGCVRYTG